MTNSKDPVNYPVGCHVATVPPKIYSTCGSVENLAEEIYLDLQFVLKVLKTYIHLIDLCSLAAEDPSTLQLSRITSLLKTYFMKMLERYDWLVCINHWHNHHKQTTHVCTWPVFLTSLHRVSCYLLADYI